MSEKKKQDWTFGGLLENSSDDDYDADIIKHFKQRVECYEIAKRIGLLTTDEIRKLERLPERDSPGIIIV